MKKLLLTLALCSLALPSYGKSWSSPVADRILSSGQMLSSTYDTERQMFIFVMFCGIAFRTPDHSYNPDSYLTDAIPKIAFYECHNDPNKVKEGIYHCSVSSLGIPSCIGGNIPRD